jgi:hypothetical protein
VPIAGAAEAPYPVAERHPQSRLIIARFLVRPIKAIFLKKPVAIFSFSILAHLPLQVAT